MENEQLEYTREEFAKMFSPPEMMNKESDVYSSLGFLIVGFQGLEHEFSTFLCDLIESPVADLGTILVSKMSFGNILGAVSAICKKRKIKEEFLKELDELIGKSNVHEADRNRFIHSHYDLMETQLNLVRFRRTKHRVDPKKGLSSQSEHFDPKQLFEICYGIYETTGHVDRLKDKILMEIFPNRYEYSGE